MKFKVRAVTYTEGKTVVVKGKTHYYDGEPVYGPLFKVFAVVHKLNGKLYVTLMELGALGGDTTPAWHVWYPVEEEHRNTHDWWSGEFHNKLADRGYASSEYVDDDDEEDPWAYEIQQTKAMKMGAPHHLPAALKAREFKQKPGDQRHHYPEHVDFAGHDVTFKHS